MAICPRTNKSCPDDLCHGSGCMEMDGYQMLEVCHACGGTIDCEIPDCGTCSCDEDDYYESDY